MIHFVLTSAQTASVAKKTEVKIITNVREPRAIKNLHNVIDIFAGNSHALAIVHQTYTQLQLTRDGDFITLKNLPPPATRQQAINDTVHPDRAQYSPLHWAAHHNYQKVLKYHFKDLYIYDIFFFDFVYTLSG